MDELSTLLPAAADTTARTTRGTTTALAEAGEDLHAAPAATGTWTGTAQLGYAERAATLAARVELLAAVATAGAGIIEDYSRELGLLKGRLREIDTHLADAQHRTLDTTLTVADFTSTWAAIERWQLQRQQVLDVFDEATTTLAQRLGAVTDHVPHRPRTLTEHLDDAADVLGQQISGGLWISLGWLDDPDGWWHDVRELPAALQDQATHPLDTARDTLHLDDLEDGRYGAAGGALAGAIIGRGLGKATERAAPGHRGDGPLHGPRLPLQSLDEMLVGVDLDRSENVNGGHTISRHVDVTDEFLERRLFQGTLNAKTGVYGKPLDEASRWSSLAVAQVVITRALRENEATLRSMGPGDRAELEVRVPPSSGTLLLKVDEKAIEQPVGQALVVVRRDKQTGDYYILTAYLKGETG